jgi:hypothetical protein
MHDMTGEEKNKREVLLAALDAWNPLPGFLFTRSEEARHVCTEMPATQPQANNPLFRASSLLTGTTSITALQERGGKI